MNNGAAAPSARRRGTQLTAQVDISAPAAAAWGALGERLFRGLGDPLRVRILEPLRAEGEPWVGDLVTRLGEPQPKISKARRDLIHGSARQATGA